MPRVPRQVRMRLRGKVDVAWSAPGSAAGHEMMASRNKSMHKSPSFVGRM